MSTRYVIPRRIAGGKFQQTLLDYLREVEAQGARINTAPVQRKHEAALFELAEAVRGLAVDSSVVGRLQMIQRHTTGGGDLYRPGNSQRRFLTHLGPSNATLSGSALLDELELAATEDLIAALNERVRVAREAVAAETRAAIRAKYEGEATRAQASERQALSKVAGLEATIAELTGDRDFLRGRLDNGAEPEDGEPEPKRYRRKHFEGDPSCVFRTERADDTVVYEVKVGDAKWHTFDSRDEAIEKRNALVDGDDKKPDEPSPLATGGVLDPRKVGF